MVDFAVGGKENAVASLPLPPGMAEATLLHQQHRTAAFDFARDLPVHVRRHACDSPRQNFPALGHELFQQIGILVIDCFRRDIDAAARHGAIGASESGAAFGGLWLHEISESRGEAYAFSKTDCIFLFQPVRGARALLVSRRHVTRNRFAQRLSLSAFQCDNFLRH